MHLCSFIADQARKGNSQKIDYKTYEAIWWRTVYIQHLLILHLTYHPTLLIRLRSSLSVLPMLLSALTSSQAPATTPSSSTPATAAAGETPTAAAVAVEEEAVPLRWSRCRSTWTATTASTGLAGGRPGRWFEPEIQVHLTYQLHAIPGMGNRENFDIVPLCARIQTYWQTDTLQCPKILISSHTACPIPHILRVCKNLG